MSYIEREALLSAAKGHNSVARLKTVMKRIPAADVRPVVLCRDCVRWKEAEGGWHICVYYRDVPAVRMENDFCSRGKKRGES